MTDPLLSADREREAAGSYTEPRTKAGQRLDLAWPAEMDRLAWRKAITAIEIEAEASVDRFALSSQPASDAGLRATLDTLVRAVGDYKWLLNGRDGTGHCTLGCEATEGQYHAEDCPAGVLSTAYLEAGAALAALSQLGEPNG